MRRAVFCGALLLAIHGARRWYRWGHPWGKAALWGRYGRRVLAVARFRRVLRGADDMVGQRVQLACAGRMNGKVGTVVAPRRVVAGKLSVLLDDGGPFTVHPILVSRESVLKLPPAPRKRAQARSRESGKVERPFGAEAPAAAPAETDAPTPDEAETEARPREATPRKVGLFPRKRLVEKSAAGSSRMLASLPRARSLPSGCTAAAPMFNYGSSVYYRRGQRRFFVCW